MVQASVLGHDVREGGQEGQGVSVLLTLVLFSKLSSETFSTKDEGDGDRGWNRGKER